MTGVDAEPVLQVHDLVTRFETPRGTVRAVEQVSFEVGAGETLALVGESGSGKSVTALSLMRLVRPPGRVVSGRVIFGGRDLLSLREREMRKVRGGGIGMVFQDPLSSLDPVMRIRTQLEEAMLAHGKFTRRSARDRAVELMARVGIPDPEARLAEYPHAFSGGMRQRVGIAVALANQPDLIIADEPTTALDVTIQAQILELLGELNRDLGTAIILITHNLGVVARTCQRVAVMYGGRIVEKATAADLFAQPRHPYTRALLAATPRIADDRQRPLVPIEGRPPDLVAPIPGCAFAPRCEAAQERCHREEPAHLRRHGPRQAVGLLGRRSGRIAATAEDTSPVGDPRRGLGDRRDPPVGRGPGQDLPGQARHRSSAGNGRGGARHRRRESRDLAGRDRRPGRRVRLREVDAGQGSPRDRSAHLRHGEVRRARGGYPHRSRAPGLPQSRAAGLPGPDVLAQPAPEGRRRDSGATCRPHGSRRARRGDGSPSCWTSWGWTRRPRAATRTSSPVDSVSGWSSPAH